MDIKIRPATKEDAAFITEIMIIAGRSQMDRGIWDVAFSLSEKDRMSKIQKLLLTSTPSVFHYSYFVIAEVDGEPAAGMCGYNVKPGSEKNLIYALREISFSKEEVSDFLTKMYPFSTCYPETPEDTWIVECVATLPQFRRRGLTNCLLNSVLEKGKSLGYKKFQITVNIGNTPAKQAYLKAGFKEYDVKTSEAYEETFGVPGIERLQMVL